MKFLSYLARNGLFASLPFPSTLSADEVVLWRSVIDKALHDIGSNQQKIREEALKWFDLENPDFVEVCAYAFLQPEYVYEKYQSKLKYMALKNKDIKIK